MTVFQTQTEGNKKKFDTFTKILILSQIPTYYFKEFITNKEGVKKNSWCLIFEYSKLPNNHLGHNKLAMHRHLWLNILWPSRGDKAAWGYIRAKLAFLPPTPLR